MVNDDESTTNEGNEANEGGEPEGPKVILFADSNGEIQVATKDGSFHPQAIVHMLTVAKAKMEFLQFGMMLRQAEQQQVRQSLLQGVRRLADGF